MSKTWDEMNEPLDTIRLGVRNAMEVSTVVGSD
jgi:hypothetical protein